MASRRSGRKGRRAAAGGTPAQISAGGDPGQLLPMAVRSHEDGNLSRARALYEQILELDPAHADTLQYYAILCHQAGDPARAESLLRQAISANPAVAAYHDNLGTVLDAAGRADEALAAYAAAEALEPGDALRCYNLGVIHERAGRIDDAQDLYRRAIEIDASDLESRFALANLLKRSGALEQAQAAYREVLAAAPDHRRAQVNLGNLLQETGHLEEAGALFREVLEAQPDNAAAWYALGRSLLTGEDTDPARAQSCFESALRLAPDLAAARVALGRALEVQGRFERALAAYRAVCTHGDPDTAADARAGLLRVLRVHPPARRDGVIAQVLEQAAASGTVPMAGLARALAGQVAAALGLREPHVVPGDAALALAREHASDPLLALLLRRTVNVVPEVERWLTAVRAGLLLRSVDPDPVDTELLTMLEQQCRLNEYVFAATGDELDAVSMLRQRLESALAGMARGQPVAPGLDAQLVLYACYAPPESLQGAPALSTRADPGADHPVRARILEALSASDRERELAALIPSLGEPQDATTRAVSAQYEQNPYPRWQELPAPSGRGLVALTRLHGAARVSWDPHVPLDVLVAGCGTGQEALAVAAGPVRHRVTAVDLSRASLGYGARMAQVLGVGGVEFVHGDLMQVRSLGREFDVVTATGVLHHMTDPLSGWRALLGVLRPGGVMRVGLYSRRARAVVREARARISALGLGAGAGDVRDLRARVLAGAEPALASLLDSEDFYTVSGCRDLLFHPVEHQFDLEQIGEIIRSLGLELLDFEPSHPILRTRMRELSPGADATDIAAWMRLECEMPQAFEGMYVFWCRRR